MGNRKGLLRLQARHPRVVFVLVHARIGAGGLAFPGAARPPKGNGEKPRLSLSISGAITRRTSETYLSMLWHDHHVTRLTSASSSLIKPAATSFEQSRFNPRSMAMRVAFPKTSQYVRQSLMSINSTYRSTANPKRPYYPTLSSTPSNTPPAQL